MRGAGGDRGAHEDGLWATSQSVFVIGVDGGRKVAQMTEAVLNYSLYLC